MQDMDWKTLSSRVVYANRFMTVTEDEVVTAHGDRVTYGIVHKRPGVSVIPFDGEKYYLIRQYRLPVDYRGWEFPAGHVEDGDIEGSARMELEEEAGLCAGKLLKIGSYYEAPGHLDQEIHIYLATGLSPGVQNLEPAEKGLEIGQFTLEEIEDMMRKGEIKDGLTIGAYSFLMVSRNMRTDPL